MENKFVMNNFREIKKSLPEHFISFENSNLRESICSLINSKSNIARILYKGRINRNIFIFLVCIIHCIECN